MKMLDLFSGIGGFSLAASWAGIETVGFCEQDKFCQAVLKKHWPDVPIVDDIFKLRGDEFGTVDIISGGFPCQPFSLAGKRAGTEDNRYLWPEMLRVIETARPTWVLGENVAGIVSMALDNVLSDLERIGYEAQAIIIPACAVDAPHRRDRVWILAHTESGRTMREPRDVCKADGGQGKALPGKPDIAGYVANSAQRRIRCRMPSGKAGQPSCGGEDVANTRSAGIIRRTGENTQGASSEIKRCGSNRNGGSTQPGLGRVVDGLPDRLDGYWQDEPEGIPRIAKGIKHRAARLKGLGNAIVPQVAFRFLSLIAMIESGGKL